MNDDRRNDFYYDRTNEYESESKGQQKEEIDYERIILEKNKSRAWSAASFVLSVFSLLCCCISLASIVIGLFAVVCAIISRKNLGYFDGLSIAGLIIGIFGVIFGATSIIASLVIDLDYIYEEIFSEMQTDI